MDGQVLSGADLEAMAEFPEMNPAPVFRFDREGRVLLANRAARRIFERDDLIGSSWLEICPGADAALWRRVLEDAQPPPLEAGVGARRFVFTHVRSTGGESVFAYGADVTAQRVYERQIEEQAAVLALQARFPDMNPGPVLRLDPAARVLLANKAAAEVFGETLLGACWTDVLPGLDAAGWERIKASVEVVQVEAVVQDRVWVFAHRCDRESDLVFVYGADITFQKQAERALRQSEKMATLGTLVAGVAHELNNPAAASSRAADQLKDALARLEAAHLRMAGEDLQPPARAALEALERQARDRAGVSDAQGALDRADREAALEDWLDDHGIVDAWKLAPMLLAQGLDAPAIESLGEHMAPATLAIALEWAAALFPAYSLLYEVSQASTRISEIVRALKSYSYLGQAPILAVDLHEGLDNTLVILRSKLKGGVAVNREYAPDLPRVIAYGSELNQVWTNLIDNAVDALAGQGQVTIRTRVEGTWAVVEVEDDGPGIPADVQPHVFDPFFTTKDPGKGTGLGLSTSYGIVVDKHRGELTVTSRPGHTRFTVRLPIAGPPSAAGQPTGEA